MKQQSVGTVLCALLLTTFGHEILQRHHVAHSAKQASEARSHFLTRHHQASNRLNIACPVVCERQEPLKPETIVAINSTTGLIGFYQVEAKLAIIIDIKLGMFAFVNQTSNTAIVVTIKDQSIVTGSAYWEKNVEFSVYFSNLQSLIHCLESGKKVPVSEVSEQLKLYLLQFELNGFEGEALTGFLQIISEIVSISKSVLVVFKSGAFKVRITLIEFCQTIRGFKNVIDRVENAVNIIIQERIKLEIQVLLSAKSSLEIFAYLCETMPVSLLQKIFKDLSTSEKVLEVLVILSGNSTENVNGVLNILWYITRINQIENVENLIEALFEYIISGRSKDTKNDLKAGVEVVIKVINKHKLGGSLGVTLKILVAIQEGKWVENGVNLSEVIEVLTAKPDNSIGLVLVIRVLILIQKVVKVVTTIVILVLYTIKLLVLRGGIKIVAFIFGIQIEQKYIDSSNPLREILKTLNISIFNFKWLDELVRLDILGDVFRLINEILASLKLNITIQIALLESPSILKQIATILLQCKKGGLEIGVGIGPVTLPGLLPPFRGPGLPHKLLLSKPGSKSESDHVGGSYSKGGNISGGSGGKGGEVDGNSQNANVGGSANNGSSINVGQHQDNDAIGGRGGAAYGNGGANGNQGDSQWSNEYETNHAGNGKDDKKKQEKGSERGGSYNKGGDSSGGNGGKGGTVEDNSQDANISGSANNNSSINVGQKQDNDAAGGQGGAAIGNGGASGNKGDSHYQTHNSHNIKKDEEDKHHQGGHLHHGDKKHHQEKDNRRIAH